MFNLLILGHDRTQQHMKVQPHLNCPIDVAKCSSNYFAYVCLCSRLLVSSARHLGVIMFLLQSYYMDRKQSLINFCLAYSCQMVNHQFKYVLSTLKMNQNNFQTLILLFLLLGNLCHFILPPFLHVCACHILNLDF